jgi:hypothetical protein
MHSIPRSFESTSTRPARARRGSVLVEFSLVAFALYLLMVVLLDLSRGSLATQTLQGTADLMAQELARAPIDGQLTFEEALDEEYVKTRVFDAAHLVIELQEGLQTPQELEAHFATLPIVNQMLRPLMFRDRVQSGSGELSVLRYPGAIVKDDQGSLTVLIPYILGRDYFADMSDAETIAWVPVVQEVKESAEAESHFAIDSSSDFRGIVNLRFNYPYQAAAMTAYNSAVAPTGPGSIALASDASVVEDGPLPDGYSELAVEADSGVGPYSGKYGLGRHYTFVAPGVTSARPFRKLISVQAVARREVVFGAGD